MRPYGQRTGQVTYPERRTRARHQLNASMNTQHNASRAERMRLRRKPKKAERQLARRELHDPES